MMLQINIIFLALFVIFFSLVVVQIIWHRFSSGLEHQIWLEVLGKLIAELSSMFIELNS